MMRTCKKRSDRQTKMTETIAKKSKATMTNPPEESTTIRNFQAEAWAQRLSLYQQTREPQPSRISCSPTYLTSDGNSWYILVKGWLPTPDAVTFEQEWYQRPANRHQLVLFGKTVEEKRWSQSWGKSYTYSGSTNDARSLDQSPQVQSLLEMVNEIATLHINLKEDDNRRHQDAKAESTFQRPYNCCLQNWYTPQDRIGLHSDDERDLCPEFPIFSLSWGGTRRFLFRSKNSRGKDVTELWIQDGDLLLMGGTCQETHKHEVPKVRNTLDPVTSNRINFTLRAFRS